MAEQRLKYKETECYSIMPIAVQACLRIRRLALHFCKEVLMPRSTRMCESGQTVATATLFAPEPRLRIRAMVQECTRLWSTGRNPAPAPSVW
jgi:hypothetical protein